MDNYVHVGNIIEQERLKRQEQISKGISSDVFDHIEKAHSNDFSQVEVTTDDNLTRFANDVSQLNKAETELLLHKLQRQINADSTSQLLKSFRSIALSHMDAIEKGVYADNPLNRKLGRVGQEWHRGKKKNSWEGIADPVERKRVQSFEEQGFSVGEQIRSEKAKAKSSRKDFMRRKHIKAQGIKNPYSMVLKLAAGKKIEKLDNGYTIKYEHKVDKEIKNEKGLNLKGYAYAELSKNGKRVGYIASEKGSEKDFNDKIAEWKNLAQNSKKKLKSGELPNIEKAHNVGDVHPNGKWIWTDLGNGKFDWKSKNGKYHKGGKGNQEQANAKTSEKKPQKKSVLDSKVDIYTIPNAEYRRITQHLEKKNPNASDAGRHLEEEAMSDKGLRNFLAVAEYFSHSSKVNKLTREYCQKWAELARDEVRNRKKQK